MPLPVLPSLGSLSLGVLLLSACTTLDSGTPARPIAPMPGLGSIGFQVTAQDEQARAWFTQGLLLAYAFEHQEAARVFRAALARDPRCAMCAWGVAYALGPNINNSSRGPEREIRRHVERAQQAAAGASPKERALIQAMAVRYGRAEAQEQRLYEAQGSAMCSSRKSATATERKVDPQELAYAAAMTEVLRQFPDDPDVVALYADAVMSTLPWDWWDRKTGKPNGQVGEVIQQLSAITQKHPEHPGALHFYVHVAEHSPDPRQAELAADTLGSVAPEAPHLVHMGSHIYKNLGRFADGSHANEQALATQKRFDAILKTQGVDRPARWDAHHLHFLWYAALMEGRGELSLRTAREFAQRFGQGGDGHGEYAQLLPLATLVRLQRWDAVLAEPEVNAGLGLLDGYDHFARGMAYAHTGRLAQAQAELARLDRIREQPTLQRSRLWGEPMPPKMLKLAHALLAGQMARVEGRREDAIAQLREAAELDDEMGNDPPMLGGGARLAFAATLLEAGRLDEAGQEIAEALRLNGPSTWTHLAQAKLEAARGARDAAQRHTALAQSAWQKADGELPRL